MTYRIGDPQLLGDADVLSVRVGFHCSGLWKSIIRRLAGDYVV